VSGEERELVIRHIVVALDASPHSVAALQAAIDLATRFRAELAGLFVEDVNLLRLSELPFAQEIGLFSGRRRRIDPQELERQIRVQTLQVRRLFAGATERAQIRWSFRVVRGAVAPEVLRAALDADVLILGRAGLSLLRAGRMGSTTRAIVTEGPSLTFILQHEACLGTPVMLVYDGSPLAQKALIAAATLAQTDDGMLIVLLLTDRPEQAPDLQAEVSDWLANRELKVQYRALTASTVDRLAQAIHNEECGTLVLPAGSELLQNEMLQALLEEIKVPVLLVRE
jgi:nucleotide-binding universal stress UspA family protein